MSQTPAIDQTPFIQALHEALETHSKQTLSALLKDAHPATIADAIEALPRSMRLSLWELIEPHLKGEILIQLHEEARRHLINETSNETLLTALSTLEMDELVDLQPILPSPVMQTIIRAMDRQRRKRFEQIQSYPDDTAGGLMDLGATAVRQEFSLQTARRYLRYIRSHSDSLPEHLNNLMVIDRDNKLIGVLKLIDILSLPSHLTVKSVMETNPITVSALTPSHQVARLFEDHDLVSIPVTDDDGTLLGRITVDDVVDVIRNEAEHAVMSRAGLHEATDMFAPILTSARRRIFWLMIHLVNILIAAYVIGLFEHSIKKIVALAIVLPIAASMGGIAGVQTLTLVTRGLALEQILTSNTWLLLFREILLSSLNGIFCAIIVGCLTMLWFNDLPLSIVIGSALTLNIIVGSIVGTATPMVLSRLKIDPALAGGAILTAVTDIVGFFSLLGLATLFLV